MSRCQSTAFQVIASHFGWLLLADSKDLVQYPAAARTVRFQNLVATRWMTAIKAQQPHRHVGPRGESAGEAVVDLHQCVYSRRGQTPRRCTG